MTARTLRYTFRLSERSLACRDTPHTWSRYPGPLTRLLFRLGYRQTCARCGTKRGTR